MRQVLSVLAHHGSGDATQAFQRGALALGMPQLTLMPLDQCSVSALGKALFELANCYPLLKPKILKAMAMAASDDGTICEQELELVATMAAVMDCPVPQAMLENL